MADRSRIVQIPVQFWSTSKQGVDGFTIHAT